MAKSTQFTTPVRTTLNKKHKIVLAMQSGHFSEGKYEGELYIGTNGMLLFNFSDKTQYEIQLKDITKGVLMLHRSQQWLREKLKGIKPKSKSTRRGRG